MNHMAVIRVIILVAATMGVGLMAGVFWLYSHTIMPALGRTDDRTFVAAFQATDRAIVNPMFIATFVGALGLTGLATLMQLGADGRSGRPWTIGAFVLYLAVFIITIRVNVPLNNGIKAAGDPDEIPDLAAVRARFDERTWVRWNHVRTVATTVAFGLLVWSLVLYGRS
jgi:uncharacterized membrane protein